MTASLIDGKALAARVRDRITNEVGELERDHGITPGLAAVLVGDDPASKVYVGMKHRDCESVGIASRQVELPADTTQDGPRGPGPRAQRRRRHRRDPRPAAVAATTSTRAPSRS